MGVFTVGGKVWIGIGSIQTLGSGLVYGNSFGNVFDAFKILASSNNALRVVSPTFMVGMIDFGGAVRILMIPPAVWRKKSSSLISGKGMFDGKNVTVSTSCTALVFRKKLVYL